MVFKIIHFSSPDCPLCIPQDKVLRMMSDELNITVQNQLIISAFDMALKYGVKSAPTLVFMIDEQAVKVLPGFQSRENIVNTLNQFKFTNTIAIE
jgi:thioredoxin-related protein